MRSEHASIFERALHELRGTYLEYFNLVFTAGANAMTTFTLQLGNSQTAVINYNFGTSVEERK